MVKVNVLRDKENKILRFRCEGHAEYVKGPGEADIVCAAVSGIIYTALGYMEEYFGLSDFEEKNGFISWEKPKGLETQVSDKIDTVLDAMVVGLKQIELQYSRNIRVVDEEV